jgi:hypothetical protein
LASKWDLMDWKSAMPLVMTLVPFLVLRNSKFYLTTFFSCSCNCIRLVVDVRIVGGGLPVLPGTASSFEVTSVPEASVSMSAALRRAKKFQVTTSLGGYLRLATFWFALLLSLRFRRFRRWRAACASVLLGNYHPAFFVSLWLLVG